MSELFDAFERSVIQAVHRAIKNYETVQHDLSEVKYPTEGRMYRKSDTCEWLGISLKTLENIPFSELPFIQYVPRGERKYLGRDIRAYIERRYLAQTNSTY